MDVYKLDRQFIATDLVEGWTSMIWTERHKELGDFQMKSPRISEIMALIPEGSLLGIKDSREVMLVETHSIGYTDKGVPELTTSGRTLDLFLGHRILTGPYQTPWVMKESPMTVQDAVESVIWNTIVNTAVVEYNRPYAWDHLARGNIPNVCVTESIVLQTAAGTGTVDDLITKKEWWLQAGNVLEQITNFMSLATSLGIRTVRPRSAGNANTKQVVFGTDGKAIKVPNAAGFYDFLRFDIYNGRNRTNAPSAVDPLPSTIFSHEAGHLERPSYLFSVKDKKTMVHTQSSIKSIEVYGGETGLDHLEMWVDGGTISNTISPTEFEKKLTTDSLAEYNRRRRLALVDAGISANTNLKFGHAEDGGDYYLGDSVVLVGRYGVKSVMLVNEFIRTSDKKNGDRGYPTLTTPQ